MYTHLAAGSTIHTKCTLYVTKQFYRVPNGSFVFSLSLDLSIKDFVSVFPFFFVKYNTGRGFGHSSGLGFLGFLIGIGGGNSCGSS